MTFNPHEIKPPSAVIKVIGIGGGGGNAINTMIKSNIEGVEFISVNTDVQALQNSLAENRIQIGKELTKGLGAGADPDIGRDAALEDRHSLSEALASANMVFVTAGMGGGTGTGGIPIVAQIAKDMGALTVGVVTKPFSFEGKRRKKIAEIGIAKLKEHVDTLITIPNQRLLQLAKPDMTMKEAFRIADNVLVNAVKGISEIINVGGDLNVDFADVKTIMSGMGLALMGIGVAEGENRGKEAAKKAISSPLLEDINIEGATGILMNITVSPNVTVMEMTEACSVIHEAAHEDATIIWGAVFDENMGNKMQVTVIATGFPAEDDEVQTICSPMKQLPKRADQSNDPPGLQIQSEPMQKPPSITAFEKSDVSFSTISREPSKEESILNDFIPYNIDTQKDQMLERSLPPIKSSGDFDAAELAAMTLQKEKTPTNGFPSIKISKEPKPEEETLKLRNDLLIGKESAPAKIGGTSGNSVGTPFIDPEIEFKIDEEQLDISPVEPIAAQEHEEIIEKKIDAAIDLAQRLYKDDKEISDDEDNLDVPAFLRNGMKDLSLS
ncbi:MAG: cell division protein FtsZ [Oligoflexales bacterium]|nr:cell division protein FtsZ [Oligoflexales bacterium]